MKIQYYIFIVLSVSWINAYNKMHVQMVQQLSAKGQPINVSGCDFRGAAGLLKSVNFSNAQASGAAFNINDANVIATAGTVKIPNQTTDLTGVNFSGAQLVSADFRGSILKNANFTGANVLFADFTNADLTGAQIDKVQNLFFAKFCGAIMPDGSKCTGKTWTSKTGKQIYCHCAS